MIGNDNGRWKVKTITQDWEYFTTACLNKSNKRYIGLFLIEKDTNPVPDYSANLFPGLHAIYDQPAFRFFVRQLQVAFADFTVEIPIFLLEPVEFFTTFSGETVSNGDIQEDSQVRAESSGSCGIYLFYQFKVEPASETLIGCGGIVKSVADDNLAFVQGRVNHFFNMLGPRG